MRCWAISTKIAGVDEQQFLEIAAFEVWLGAIEVLDSPRQHIQLWHACQRILLCERERNPGTRVDECRLGVRMTAASTRRVQRLP